MNRPRRKTIANETLDIIECGEYVLPNATCVRIGDAVDACVAGTRLFTPEELSELASRGVEPIVGRTRYSVRNETTLQAAARLAAEQDPADVLCLNFASAKNPGGGFLGGSQAQEESLARSSALYASLTAAPGYYDVNRACGTPFYTDHMILSPGVPVFRDDRGDLLDAPYEVSFLTAPAVNAGAVKKNEPHRSSEIPLLMRRRIEMVLALAASEGYRHLVLGAWGCGVFRNDPAMVAGLFAEQLLGDGRYARSFERVAFAVLDGPEGAVLSPFENAFDREVVD